MILLHHSLCHRANPATKPGLAKSMEQGCSDEATDKGAYFMSRNRL
jgi:hypothetical protein